MEEMPKTMPCCAAPDRRKMKGGKQFNVSTGKVFIEIKP